MFNAPLRVCEDCYPGYELNDKRDCIRVEETEQSSLCKRFDSSISICIECVPRAYLNRRGVCEAIDEICKTFDA